MIPGWSILDLPFNSISICASGEIPAISWMSAGCFGMPTRELILAVIASLRHVDCVRQINCRGVVLDLVLGQPPGFDQEKTR